jgi:hypothetical protein
MENLRIRGKLKGEWTSGHYVAHSIGHRLECVPSLRRISMNQLDETAAEVGNSHAKVMQRLYQTHTK